MVLYNLLLLFLSPFLTLWWGASLFKSKYRKNWKERFGVYSAKFLSTIEKGDVIWIHAVSVGETMAALPMIEALKKRHPDKKLVLSTVTATGRETALSRIPALDGLFYFPFDLPWVVVRVLTHLRPKIVIFFETEIWPNLLDELSKRMIPAVLLNGRISDRSFRRYRLIKTFFKLWVNKFSLCLVQSNEDHEKLLFLGADARKTFRTGNTKYDREVKNERKLFPDVPFLERWDWIVAGSTHSGEEEMLLEAHFHIRVKHPRTGLILAPRHPERFEEVSRILQKRGEPLLRRSIPGFAVNALSTMAPVLLLDSIGELNEFYGWATISFVGGSLVPRGGHNILEPAIWGKAPFFGPYMENFREMAELFKSRGAGIEVENAQDMEEKMIKYLDHISLLEQAGKTAREILLENQGATLKNIQWIEKYL